MSMEAAFSLDMYSKKRPLLVFFGNRKEKAYLKETFSDSFECVTNFRQLFERWRYLSVLVMIPHINRKQVSESMF